MSLPRYPEYKDSGVEWLGEIPVHWDVKRIGYYFDERREKVSDKDFEALSVTKNGVVPQLDTAAKTDDGDNRKKVCKGDFVINSRSDRKGSSGASDLDGSVSLINTVLHPRDGIAIHFAHHLLRSQPFQEEYYRYGKGIVADLWSTNYSEMKNINLAVPPVTEQQTIAAFLDRETGKIDALIAEQQRLVELLAEKRQAVISLAVTKGLGTRHSRVGGNPVEKTIPHSGQNNCSAVQELPTQLDSRLRGNDDVAMKDSGIEWLGEVPGHWAVCALNYRYEVLLGKMLDEKRISGEHLAPYLRNADVQWGQINTIDLPEMDFKGDDLIRYALRPGDLLVCEGGEVGRAAVWDGQLQECYYQKALHRLRARNEDSDTAGFLFYVLYASAKLGLFVGSEGKSTIAHLTAEALRRYLFAFPPIDEQQVIADFLNTETAKFDTLTAEANRAIALLQERRSALISAAVTGKIDVRNRV